MAYLDVNEITNSGTWTPTITGSGSNPTVTYTTQNGFWYSIGDLVFCKGIVTINTTSGGSGNMIISLPITTDITTVADTVGNCYVANLTYSGYLTVLATSGNNNLYLREHASGSGVANVQISALTAGFQIVFYLTYWK